MRKIAHIINPVIVKEASDLYAAQPVTFETMRRAREFAKGTVEVNLLTAQFPEDRPLVPEGFKATPDLGRSVLEMGSFAKKRKLPLLRDILDRLYDASEGAEYLVYTNVDIALMPHFYLAVDRFVEEGFDGFVVNRRTIPDRYKGVDELPLMYMDIGKPHPGHDCFVFRRESYPSFNIGGVCVGASLVGRVLLFNVFCHSKSFKEFGDEHLTFHLGDDRAWTSPELSDYAAYNLKEALAAARSLEERLGPLAGRPFLAPFVRDLENNRQGALGRLVGKLRGATRG